MLWTALHYPSLPLERQAEPDADRPRAVAVRDGARRVVLIRDEAAAALGVRPGQALKGALAIVPHLRVTDFDACAQAAQLEQLALQALRWSPRVTLCPPDAVLVEVRGSLRLFGGLDALLGLLRADAAAQGLTLRLGTAPTPAAAALLARAARDAPVRATAALAAALADVPIEHLAAPGSAFDEAVSGGLRRAGVRTVGQLAALPPAAVSRRFGQRACDALYRLDGRLPDPRTPFLPPPAFAVAADLPLETRAAGGLAFLLRRLVAALEGFLRQRDLGVLALELSLFHRRRAPTVLALRFLEPTGDAAHLRRVASERLDALTLVAPVTRLALEATSLAALARAAPSLIDDATPSGATIEAVVDRLAARLGERSVRTVLARDDHRPEKAWSEALRAARRPPERWPARPLWLLARPRIATEPLVLGPDAERIENGWWEEGDVRRDYFIARDARGTHYWVYRLRHDPEHVWIHGLFA